MHGNGIGGPLLYGYPILMGSLSLLKFPNPVALEKFLLQAPSYNVCRSPKTLIEKLEIRGSRT